MSGGFGVKGGWMLGKLRGSRLRGTQAVFRDVLSCAKTRSSTRLALTDYTVGRWVRLLNVDYRDSERNTATGACSLYLSACQQAATSKVGDSSGGSQRWGTD